MKTAIKNVDKSVIIPTEQPKWKPTPAMRIWIDKAVEIDSDEIAVIARECGLDRTNWYTWIKDDNFLSWWKAEWDKRLASEAWKLDKIGLKQSKRDHKYWESMQRRVGNMTDNNFSEEATFTWRKK